MLIAEIGSRTNNIIQLLCSIAVFALVLFITFWVTKWIGNYQHAQMKNSSMEVVETMRIMNGKYIQIVRIEDEYIVIAVCKDTVTFLLKLDDFDEQDVKKTESTVKEDFKDVLSKLNFKKK